ncbi:hypothetical protein H6G97_31960 [Nostoc flagelliforme FACHB-838]|uniref:Uncharacterized protein n=1 Tax=Nostoc flagelliforme FACHB-838 TaxID=2692904 RepID=A0ABR8DWR9_9NOSO|nr:hypothetical protein [Nostoc flagelliforme]MBD2533912.1 hypothetical protein [Nostoc flagelliforme FACHB-838]
MNPEAKHIVSELRREFYSNFVAAMNMPVNITGTSYSNNSPIASWIDHRQRLNYINVYAYTAPDEFVPLCPFILRLGINKSAGRVMVLRKGQVCRGLNLVWDFELTVLPKEILDFLPWIVKLVESHDKGSPLLIESPPHSFELKVSEVELFNNAWTQQAWLLANS